MYEVGDGHDGQPTEGVGSIDEIADALIGEPAPGESEQDESEAPEGIEPEEEEEADEEGEEDEEERTFTIKVDGKEVSLTESELIERAQKGHDYTAKTMAVAEERKVVEQERSRISEARAKVEQDLTETVNRLTAYSQFIESELGNPPDVGMLDYDPGAYVRAKEKHEARRGQLQQAYAEIQRLEGEQARQRQASIASKIESTEKVLRDTLPGWGEDTLNTYAGYADKLGLNPKTAEAAMLEPGFWQLVHKAQAFDAIQAKKAEMKPKEQLAKVAKPSAQNQTAKATERSKRAAAFDKNPSVDALADLLR